MQSDKVYDYERQVVSSQHACRTMYDSEMLKLTKALNVKVEELKKRVRRLETLASNSS